MNDAVYYCEDDGLPVAAVVIGLAFAVVEVRSCNTTAHASSRHDDVRVTWASYGERKSLPATEALGLRGAVTNLALEGFESGGKDQCDIISSSGSCY